MHTDDHNTPRAGGSLQLKLWADGNKWWSGIPSTTDTFLRVKNIIAYYNTSTSRTNKEWNDECQKEKTQCKAAMKLDWPPMMLPPSESPSSCVGAMQCSTGIGADPSPTLSLQNGPSYTGHTAPKVTPPSAGGPRTSGSEKLGTSMWIVGGVGIGLAMVALSLV